MRGVDLSEFLRRVVQASGHPEAVLRTPVLVWERPGETSEPALQTQTNGGFYSEEPRNPRIYEVKKSHGNAFALGITVGRTPNNDVALELRTVSRFHAYFQQDPSSDAWRLVDAESKLGTFLDNVKLVPNEPVVLGEKCRIRFGTAELLFFMPEKFLEFAAAWRR